MTAGMTTISDSNFAQFVTGNKVAVLYIRRDRFSPCRMLLSSLIELTDELGGEPAFGECIAESSRGIVDRLRLYCYPTVVTFVGGKEYDRHGWARRNLCRRHL